MKDNHGLKCSDEQVFECLDITTPTMNSDEAKQWLNENRVVRKPIEGVPVWQGVGCSLCSYSAKKRDVIYNHISSAHKDEGSRVTVIEQKVQKPFRSRLKQYIQLDTRDESNAVDEDVEDWKLQLNEDFARLVEDHDMIEGSGSFDLKLINAFVAKIRYKSTYIFKVNIRWDVHLTGVNTQNLVKLVQVPTIRDPLHRLILCGRRYIKECCKKLNRGNMIVRRALMIAK